MQKQDVICVDGEFKVISNEIVNYIDFLIESIAKYNRILGRIQTFGIQDELIRGKLYNLSVLLNSYKKELIPIATECKHDISKYLSQIQENDKFSFPFEEISVVEGIINAFM